MTPETVAECIHFILSLREASARSGPPPGLTVSADCCELSPERLGSETYLSRIQERRDWCDERCPGKYHHEAYRDSTDVLGRRYWFADMNIAFEFRLRFGRAGLMCRDLEAHSVIPKSQIDHFAENSLRFTNGPVAAHG